MPGYRLNICNMKLGFEFQNSHSDWTRINVRWQHGFSTPLGLKGNFIRPMLSSGVISCPIRVAVFKFKAKFHITDIQALRVTLRYKKNLNQISLSFVENLPFDLSDVDSSGICSWSNNWPRVLWWFWGWFGHLSGVIWRPKKRRWSLGAAEVTCL